MPRVIHSSSRLCASEAAACVASLLALELLSPGKILYINTNRIGNAVVLRNDLAQFSALFDGEALGSVRLPTVLSLLAERERRSASPILPLLRSKKSSPRSFPLA